MTVTVGEDGSMRLHGVCPVDDAEALLRGLLAASKVTVDWRDCVQAHTAVVQILLAARPKLLGPPEGEFLRTHIAPLIDGGAATLPPHVP